MAKHDAVVGADLRGRARPVPTRVGPADLTGSAGPNGRGAWARLPHARRPTGYCPAAAARVITPQAMRVPAFPPGSLS